MKQFAFFFFLLDRKLIDLPSFNQRRICFEAELYFSKVRLPPTSGCLLPLECSLTEFPIGHLTWSPGLFAQLLVNTSLCFFNSASFFFFFASHFIHFQNSAIEGKTDCVLRFLNLGQHFSSLHSRSSPKVLHVSSSLKSSPLPELSPILCLLTMPRSSRSPQGKSRDE